jgi:hypothetical protein
MGSGAAVGTPGLIQLVHGVDQCIWATM